MAHHNASGRRLEWLETTKRCYDLTPEMTKSDYNLGYRVIWRRIPSGIGTPIVDLGAVSRGVGLAPWGFSSYIQDYHEPE